MTTHRRRFRRTTHLAAAAAWLLAAVPPAAAGPVADLIVEAGEMRSARSEDEIPPAAIVRSLRKLEVAGVSEALFILTGGSETREDVLVGLMRGLALIDEYTADTQIESGICPFTSGSNTLRLQMEAVESLRLRCVGHPPGCGSCPGAVTVALDLLGRRAEPADRLRLAQAVESLAAGEEAADALSAAAAREDDPGVRSVLLRAGATVATRARRAR
jgi:hypothetical protein